MRRLLLCLVALAGIAAPAHAGIARVGRGIATTSAPPIYYTAPSPDDAGVSRMLYRKQDLAGLPPNVPITAIEFDKRLSGALATGALTIYMKNSTATSLPTTSTVTEALAGMTEVFTTTSPAITAPSGWVRFTLTTPFLYAGDAIEVVTVWDANSGARSDDLLFAVHATGTVSTQQLNYGPVPLGATDVIASVTPRTRVNTQFLFPDPAQGFLVVEVAKTPLENGGTFANGTTFAAGAAVPVRYTLRNIGGASLALAPAIFANLANLPTPTTSTIPATLAPGASVEVTVTHTPTAANVTTGYQVTFDTDANDHVVSLTGVAAAAPAPEIQIEVCDENQVHCSLVTSGGQIYVGNAAIGQPLRLELNLGSLGSGALATPTGATSVGCTNCTLTFTEQCAASIPAGADDTVKLELVPTAGGAWGTTLRVANDDASESTYQIQITGLAVVAAPPPVPDLTVVQAGVSLAAGAIITSELSETTFTLGNAGDAPLEISAITISDATNVSTPVLSHTTLSIPAMSTFPITVTAPVIDPGMLGSYRLTLTSNDPDESPFDVAVNVDLRVPNIVIEHPEDTTLAHQDPNPHDFPVVVRNTGSVDLVVSVSAAPGDHLVSFSPTEFTVAPGRMQTVTLVITLEDETFDYWGATLTYTSNDPDQPTLEDSVGGEINYGSKGCSAANGGGGPMILVVALLLVGRPRRRRVGSATGARQ